MATGIRETTERYMELIRACPLRPITTEAELDRAIAAIDALLDRGISALSPEEDDYLDVLGTLVEKYEDVHHRMAADDEE